MKLLNILSEIVLINENLAMAKKWLMMHDIPEDDPDFVKVKDFLAKNNSLGYLGYVLKFSWDYSLNEALGIAEYILDNKEFIKLLPKSIADYKSLNELGDDIDKLKRQRKIKNFTKKLTNKKLIALLLQTNINVDNQQNIDYFLSIESGDQKEFLSKSDKYNDVETFLNELDTFVRDHKIGFTYDIVLNKIKSMSDDDIKVLLSQNNMILAIIKTYDASKEIGSKSWCIVGSADQFYSYTRNGESKQYFFFNFNSGIEFRLKMIAFTMDEDNNITASHDRFDGPFSSPLNYLKSIGVSDKIFKLNSREFFERLINKKVKHQYGDAELIYVHDSQYFGKDELEQNVNFNLSLKTIASNVFKLLKKSKGYHLDLIVKKFENYPTKLLDYDKGNDTTDYHDYNVFAYMIKNYDNIEKYIPTYDYDYDYDYDSSEPENLILSKDEFIDILKKIYQSSIDIKEETKKAILQFLKENGVDILKLVQFKKSKRGEDLTATEFGMLTKRGENLTPIIQNKLGAIRRGEDVSMSETEINYAIDNGYKNIIMKYYKNNLPYYSEYQLTYEDLNIYKKLGMIDDITKVIVSKGNTWGLDALNSIEKSVYNMSRLMQKKSGN